MSSEDKAPPASSHGSLSDAASYYNTGEALLQQEYFQQAIYNHQQALRIRQANSHEQPELEIDSHLRLGHALEKSGNVETALHHVQQALELQRQLHPSCTKTVQLMIHVGFLLERLGNIGQALTVYQQALKLEQELNPSSSLVGNLYTKIGSLWHIKAETTSGANWDSSSSSLPFSMNMNMETISSPIPSTPREESTEDAVLPTTNNLDSTNEQTKYTLPSRVEYVEVVTRHPFESSDEGSDEHLEKEKDEDMSFAGDTDELEQEHASSDLNGSTSVDTADPARDAARDEPGKWQSQHQSKQRTPLTSSPHKDVTNKAKRRKEETPSDKAPLGKRRKRKRRRQTRTKPTANERMLPDFSFDDNLTNVETVDKESGKDQSTAKNSKPEDPLAHDCTEGTPERPSKLSRHKEQHTTISTTDTAKQLDPPFWTTDDDNALLLTRRRHPDHTWAEIAALLPGNRSQSALYSRYRKILPKKCAAPSKRPRGRPRKTLKRDSERRIVGRSSSNATWTRKELDILKRNKTRGLSWEEISRLLPGRSWRECKQRYEELRTTVKDTPASLPISDQSPSPTENEEGTNPETVTTREAALTNDGQKKEKRARLRDRPRWTEEDRRLVQSSYLLGFGPRWS